MEFGKKIRNQWLLEEDVIFLNHGSFGATPRQVMQARARYSERLEAQPMRFLVDEYPAMIRSAAGKLASFLGTDADKIVFADNATSGVNAVLRSLLPGLKTGDEILTTNHIYPAVRNTLKYISQVSGVKVIEIDVPYPSADSGEIVDLFRINLSRNTKLVLVDHVASPTALVFPVKEIAEICSMNNTLVLIDGAHAPGMLDLNLEEICCDWYVGNCHKWMFAPKSCAFIWTNPEHQAMIHPLTISLEYMGGYTREFDWTGTRDPAAWLSVVDAIAFYDSLGRQEIKAYNHDLAMEAGRLLKEKLEINLDIPSSATGSMMTLPLPGQWALTREMTTELRLELLERYNIELPFFVFGGKMWFRISAQVYNQMSDYETLAEALEEFTENKNFYGGF